MKLLAKKITTLIITLFLVSVLTFFAFQIIPGDSLSVSLGMEGNAESIEALKKELGLDENIFVRYGRWSLDFLKGNLGMSSQYKVPVNELLNKRLGITVGLTVISIVLIIVISIPLGILSAKWDGKKKDNLITIPTQIGMSVPPFFLGIIITLIFGILFKCFTPGKYVEIKESLSGYLGFMIFPALAIAIPKSAMVIRFLRSSIVIPLKMDYVRTARSKGNKENTVLYKHILKNAFIPVITFIALVFADVLAGSIIVEQVFSIPGLGRLLVNAIQNRDFYVVQAIVIYIAAIVIVINFIIDLVYQYIDPRVRLS